MQPSIIAMLTDFGDRDGYVGVMKGVMLGIYREAIIADVAHDIPRQDVWHAGWVLDNAFDYYPPGTVFVCVVDPNVGDPGQQKLAVYFETQQKALVVPDNGLASRLFKRHPDAQCYTITNKQFFRGEEEPSNTFHGRDIYAPVAAHLGWAMAENTRQSMLAFLGPLVPLIEVKHLELAEPRQVTEGMFEGQIDVVDTYGNLITNIPSDWATMSGGYYELLIGDQSYRMHYVTHYGATQPLDLMEVPLSLVAGSHGMLEISCPGASASEALQAQARELITLREIA